ncbi:MAG: sensor histidine kinase [Acidimicrobiales bacterium]
MTPVAARLPTPPPAAAARPKLRRFAVGTATAALTTAALTLVLIPFRTHVSVATTALVLVVPVVVGVAVGGFGAGTFATAVGFLVYDYVFIPPYGTLVVGSAQNWTALGVYAVVMVVVARVVDNVERARKEAQARAVELRRLFDVSELLVRDSSAAALFQGIVVAVRQAFELDGAALLLPSDAGLELVASAGGELRAGEVAELAATGRAGSAAGVRTVALVVSGRPLGLLALRGGGALVTEELLQAFANHLALALQRSQLQEQALRAGLLEEVDRLRRGLVGAVSHDLRTPLATIKVATSALLDDDAPVPPEDARELLELVEGQADRLDRLVANLLDMTRIQAGALELRRAPVDLDEVLEDARGRLGRSADLGRVVTRIPPDLPPVDADRVLIGEVLANLLDNAVRYSPAEEPVILSAAVDAGQRVVVSVADRGPGFFAGASGTGLFDAIATREAGGGGGLGLAIVQAFVEAHGERVWVESVEGGGTKVSFTLPAAR